MKDKKKFEVSTLKQISEIVADFKKHPDKAFAMAIDEVLLLRLELREMYSNLNGYEYPGYDKFRKRLGNPGYQRLEKPKI